MPSQQRYGSIAAAFLQPDRSSAGRFSRRPRVRMHDLNVEGAEIVFA
jgi:hypothetical protein